MKIKEKKERILIFKFLYTVMVLVIYMIGRKIPLYGIDVLAYQDMTVDAQSMFIQNITGEFNNCSVFILGIWPYMWASMFMILYMAIKGLDKTSRISPRHMNVVTYEITMIIAIVQAFQKSKTYIYTVSEKMIPYAQVVVIVEMVAGMLIVLWLCDRNQKFGIGARMGVFLVNITEGMFSMMGGKSLSMLKIAVLIGLIEIPFMLILETTEKRIPVQRVSIHNIYADKNYISYKLNPVGVMPIMFTSVFFMLPRLIINLLLIYFPANEKLIWVNSNMVMTQPFGIAVYLIIQSLLIFLFAFVMLDPAKISEGLMKSGDSILGIYAGKQTKKYLIGCVFRFSLYSSIVLALCMGIPLFLQFTGVLDQSLVMLPCSIMMSTGIWIMFYREAQVYRNMEKYKPFI